MPPPIRRTRVADAKGSNSLSTAILYLGFAATGIGLALPGSVLPALVTRWSLADWEAGLLFFLGWFGSSIGALMVRPSRSRSVAIGSLLLAAGALGMGWATRWTCFVWMPLYGIGLGMTMTSVSLLQATRHADRRGAELNRLNLVWAIGAAACPSLAVHSLRISSARTIFSALGLFFLGIAAWTWFCERDPLPSALTPVIDSQSRKIRWSNLTLWPLALVVAVLLPSGIEASMGAWIAAYIQRSQHTLLITVAAGSCFWAGLMFSRTIGSIVLARFHHERWVIRLCIVTIVLGLTLLLASTASLPVLVGIFLVGFGLGPVYPLLLAMALPYSENTLIFFVAGLGASIVPWLTGIVSTAAGSLKIGLIVPLLVAILLMILGFHLTASPKSDHLLR